MTFPFLTTIIINGVLNPRSKAYLNDLDKRLTEEKKKMDFHKKLNGYAEL